MRVLMPCPSTSPKMFCAGPMFWARPKIEMHLVVLQKIDAATKTKFTESMEITFGSGTICKSIFGLAEKFWQPVEGRGITIYLSYLEFRFM